MSQANPYAAPRAAVDDVHEDEVGVQPVKFFSTQGRVGRLRMLAYYLGAYVVMFLTSALGGFLGAATGSGMLTNIVLVVGSVAALIYMLMLSVQRSHDMDWSGWTVLLGIIPFVGLIWVFKPGTKGSNRFGAPPPPNTLGVKILGLFFPVVAGIGIVAAVALPAYSDYTKRAKARQGLQAPQVQPAR